jgi:hypothetical protein
MRQGKGAMSIFAELMDRFLMATSNFQGDQFIKVRQVFSLKGTQKFVKGIRNPIAKSQI